jgi:hypothetical protein
MAISNPKFNQGIRERNTGYDAGCVQGRQYSTLKGHMNHKLIDLPLRSDHRGSLGFAQDGDQIPFPVKRIFYTYNIPEGGSRAGHAHRQSHQFLIMLSGSCQMKIDDGAGRTEVLMNSPQVALYTPPLIWLDIDAFAAGSVCLVLASDVYDERDYVREYSEFRRLTQA